MYTTICWKVCNSRKSVYQDFYFQFPMNLVWHFPGGLSSPHRSTETGCENVCLLTLFHLVLHFGLLCTMSLIGYFGFVDSNKLCSFLKVRSFFNSAKKCEFFCKMSHFRISYRVFLCFPERKVFDASMKVQCEPVQPLILKKI